MRAAYVLPFLLIAYTYGCKEKPTVAPVVTSADFDKGVNFLDHQNDSAYYYFNNTTTRSKDSLKIAQAYNYMAVIQADAGDYFGSQESLLSSLKYLNEQKDSDYNCLVADYNQLGRNSADLKNYPTAISYYDQALKLIKDDYSATVALNNKAVAYQDERQYAQAIAIYQSIIEKSKNYKIIYARVLTNLARARWLQDASYNAEPELQKSLQIRKDENSDWGLNSSYAHLSEYYAHTHPDSAFVYAQNMYRIAKKLNSPDDILEALQKLILFGPPGSAKSYFAQYQQLSDSILTARSAAKNQFALIRYETEKNKANILRLQKDNSEKKIQLIKRNVTIAGIIILSVAICISIILWNRKRKQKIERESREAILKTSRKVHDVVANGLYRIMAELEHLPDIKREELLDKLEIMYEKSRDISYEEPKAPSQEYHTKIDTLLNSFNNVATRVLIEGNSQEYWINISPSIKKELELILQELMVNMKKHSKARNVIVRFEKAGNSLEITYQDDGIGLPSPRTYGNGLANTENRIIRNGGEITFDNSPPKGLKIKIYFPNA